MAFVEEKKHLINKEIQFKEDDELFNDLEMQIKAKLPNRIIHIKSDRRYITKQVLRKLAKRFKVHNITQHHHQDSDTSLELSSPIEE